MQHKFDPKILKAYDIRGIFGQNLFDIDAFTVGRCFGTILRDRGKKRVCVGRDGRKSSPQLERALVDGLMACGLDVVRIGLVSTPVLYFAEHALDADGAIMVTASHNPAEYNGFKMCLDKKSFYGDDIQTFASLASQGIYADGQGTSVDVSILPQYISLIRKDFETFYAHNKPLTVVWDCGSGAVCSVIHRLLAGLPGKHIPIFDTLDPEFTAHEPDPTIEANLTDLKKAIAQHNADLGIAFDGDGDRLSVVDSEGHMLHGDQLLQLFATEVLTLHAGAGVIADVKASQTCFDYIESLGGKAYMAKTGHAHIKQKLRESQALLAGEMSGHMFFADRYYGFDDATYAALRVVGIVSQEGFSVPLWRKSLPHVVNTPELAIPCQEHQKAEVVKNLLAQLRHTGVKVIDIDGVRAVYPQGWWLLRASNTSEKLVARAEAASEIDLKWLLQELSSRIAHSGLPHESLEILNI